MVQPTTMGRVALELIFPAADGTGAESLVDHFLEEIRTHVAVPLFSAPDVDTFRTRLPDALAHGASLRYALILDIAELPPDSAHRILHDMLHPPAELLAAFEASVREMLEPHVAHTVMRGVQSAADLAILGEGLVKRAEADPNDLAPLLKMAELNARAAVHDALYTAWAVVLAERWPVPVPAVAGEAANQFLALGEARRDAFRAVLAVERNSGRAHPLGTLDDPSRVEAWFVQHPRLMIPYLGLVAAAIADPAVTALRAGLRVDPDVGDEFLVITADVPASEWERVDDLVQDLVRRAGIVTWDDRGGMLVLSVEPT